MIEVLAAVALANAQTEQAPVVPADQKKPSVRYSDCRCPDSDEAALAIIEGIVIDAEVTLSADGLSPADRQATIFDVTTKTNDIKGRTKIWHQTKIAQCGVNFDYGKKYQIVVRQTDQGLETDECLMRRVRPAKPSAAN